MPQNFNLVQSNAVNASPGGSGEANICTFIGVTTNGPGDLVAISGFCTVTIGTAGVSALLRLRRGGIAGQTLISLTPITVVAGNVYILDLQYVDTPGEVVNQQYSMTLTVASATAASTVGQAQLQAIW